MPDTIHLNRLYEVLGIKSNSDAVKIARQLKISKKDIQYYNDERIFPRGEVLEKILKYLGVSRRELKIMLGIFDKGLIDWLADNRELFIDSLPLLTMPDKKDFSPEFKTDLGKLYQGDCVKLMRSMEPESVDMVFADPPFNLNKSYESGINDNLSENEYLIWTENWLLECIKILKPGGSLFVYNIPKWLTEIAYILNQYMDFRHWVGLNYRGYTPPIPKKLNVTHYGMLYYSKGPSPLTFNQQRIPMKTCRHCGGEIHDYGGKKKNVPKNGQVVSDIWEDIHPVRHKGRKNRDANELPLKLLLRTISLASNEGDVIFDPFGGSGTTYKAAEMLNRKWIGVEIGSLEPIINRIKCNPVDQKTYNNFIEEKNKIFNDKQIKLRIKNGFWLPEDFDNK